MGSVDCFELMGLRAWFNSSDHLGPHFHVEKVGAWEVRVFFMRSGNKMFEQKWGRSQPTAAERKMIRQRAEAHRVELLEEWQRKVTVSAPGPEV